jgi:hypothetical protein
MNIKTANNYFCSTDLSIYKWISNEVDVKLERGRSGDVGALSDAAFPPLPGTRPRGPCTREDNPKLFNKSEALRAKLLETWSGKWSLVLPKQKLR